MKLSLMSFPFQFERLSHRMNAEKLCRIITENGLDEVDLMMNEISLYGLKSLKRAFEKSGVHCGCIIAHLPFYRQSDKYLPMLKKALETCKSLNVRQLMIIPGYTDEKACLQYKRNELLNRAIEFFAIAVDRAKDYNVEILFEDTPIDYKPLSGGKDCRYVLDKVEGLGFAFDTANFMVAEKDFDILADYELLKDRISRVHFKDVVKGNFGSGERCEDGQMIRCVTTGAGIVDLRAIAKALKKDAYDGSIAIEYTRNPLVHGLDHSRYLSVFVGNIKDLFEEKTLRPACGRIPGLDKEVSRIFFGTAISSMTHGKDVYGLLDSAYASGINAFDTARGYGFAERSLGNWIRERNNRDQIVILSKCGNVDPKGNVNLNRERILKELDASLKALGVKTIDIYLLHRDDPHTSVKEFIDTLNECKKQGKIKVFGVSNWSAERIQEANTYAKENNLEGFVISSPYYGLADQVSDPWGGDCIALTNKDREKERRWYADTKLPVLAYSSLGRGFFSGRFKAFDYEGAKKVLDAPARKGYLYKENMERLARAEKLAKKQGRSITDIAISYVYSSDMNMFAVMSTENPKRFRGNIKASLKPLSEKEVLYLQGDLPEEEI